MDLKSFRAASKVAENCVRLLSDVQSHVERGEWALAYGCLSDIHKGMFGQNGFAVLDGMKDELAGAHHPDNIIHHHGLTGATSYASAHECIADICFQAYFGLMLPLEGVKDADEWESVAQQLLNERAESLTINASLMRAYIRRERAKLLQRTAPKPGAEGNEQAEAEPPKGKSGRPRKGTKPSTNALLIDLINDRPECKSWSSRKLMEPTGRSRASIEGTKMYKAAEELRIQTKAERVIRMAKRRKE